MAHIPFGAVIKRHQTLRHILLVHHVGPDGMSASVAKIQIFNLLICKNLHAAGTDMLKRSRDHVLSFGSDWSSAGFSLCLQQFVVYVDLQFCSWKPKEQISKDLGKPGQSFLFLSWTGSTTLLPSPLPKTHSHAKGLQQCQAYCKTGMITLLREASDL